MTYTPLPQDLDGLRNAYLDSMRGVLAESYRNMPANDLAALIRETMESLPPAERAAFAKLSLQNTYEGFFSNIGRGLSRAGKAVGRALPGIARAVAPVAQVAAPLVGTLVGGPLGGMAGQALGGMIGNLASRGGRRRPAPRPARPMRATPAQRRPTTQGIRPATGSSSNPAASQLMSLMANPQMLQAILGQVLGNFGQSGTVARSAQGILRQIPFGALMNSLSELALRAAEESVRAGDFESEDYLIDNHGNYRIDDPSDAAQRADAVVRLLNEQYDGLYDNIEFQDDFDDEDYDEHPTYDSVTEWLIEADMI